MTTLITPLPTPPTRQDSANFNDRADDFLGALPLFQQETNALAVDVQSSADEVEIARQAVVSTANITKWISGTTYAQGAAVWSPINGVTYRKMTTSTGGTTDPSLDNVNYKGITDSSGVIYTPAGTGAVATTVQSKLREFVSHADYGSDADYNTARAALTGRADHRVRIKGGTVDRLLSDKLGEFVSVVDLGADPLGVVDSTAAIQSALDVVKDKGGTLFFPAGQYSVSGNISATISSSVVLKGASRGYLSAAGDSGGTKIIHTGNNTCFDFQATDIWASVDIDGFEVKGTSIGSSAVFANYSDSWGSSFRNSAVIGYSGGTIVRLWNKTAWTEGFFAENLMLRDALKAFEFRRTSATGGTDSFYRFSTRNVNVVPGANGAAFHMNSTADNAMLLYGADIDVSLWFEIGGAVGFFIGDYCRFGDSTVKVKQDGIVTPDATDHFTFWQYTSAPMTLAQSFIDVEGSINAQQTNYYYVNALPTGSSIRLLKALLKPEFPEYASTDQLAPTIRVKGAKARFGDASQATNKTFVVDSLPALSNYRVTLTAYGTNLVSKAVYEVAVYDNNLLADVRLVAGYADGNILCRVFGGGTHHSFSAGNGLKFDVVVNAATFGANVSWVAEMEML